LRCSGLAIRRGLFVDLPAAETASPTRSVASVILRTRQERRRIKKNLAAKRKASSEYELHERSSRQPGLLDEVGADLAKAISAEIARLETEAEKLKSDIAELMETGETPIV
jgi:hypothetical protein